MDWVVRIWRAGLFLWLVYTLVKLYYGAPFIFALWTIAPVAAFLIPVRFRLLDEWRLKRRLKKIENQICLKCGYSVLGTPLRCPECFTPTPLAEWLDKHPLEKCIYEGLLKRRVHAPGEELPKVVLEAQEREMKTKQDAPY